MIAGAIVVALVVALMHSASAQVEKPKLDYENYCTGDWVNDWVYVAGVTVSNAVMGKVMTINYTTYVQKELKGSPYLTYSLWSSNRKVECLETFCLHLMCNATDFETECTIPRGHYPDQLNVEIAPNTRQHISFFDNRAWFLLEHFDHLNQDRRLGCVKFPIHVYDPW